MSTPIPDGSNEGKWFLRFKIITLEYQVLLVPEQKGLLFVFSFTYSSFWGRLVYLTLKLFCGINAQIPNICVPDNSTLVYLSLDWWCPEGRRKWCLWYKRNNSLWSDCSESTAGKRREKKPQVQYIKRIWGFQKAQLLPCPSLINYYSIFFPARLSAPSKRTE